MHPCQNSLDNVFGVLYQSRLMDNDECGVVGAMSGRGNRSNRRKCAPVPLYPPQFPYDTTLARTLTAVVGNLRLSAWATALPNLTVTYASHFVPSRWDVPFSRGGECIVVEFSEEPINNGEC
jgi:hypothetical protein